MITDGVFIDCSHKPRQHTWSAKNYELLDGQDYVALWLTEEPVTSPHLLFRILGRCFIVTSLT